MLQKTWNVSLWKKMWLIPTTSVFKCGTMCLLSRKESTICSVFGTALVINCLHDCNATDKTRVCSSVFIRSLTRHFRISFTTLCKRMFTLFSLSINSNEEPWIWMPTSSLSKLSSAFTTYVVNTSNLNSSGAQKARKMKACFIIWSEAITVSTATLVATVIEFG